jgi:response regulator RpfG family c-di-GMP phosphodiesterase/serine/threonine protein kinase
MQTPRTSPPPAGSRQPRPGPGPFALLDRLVQLGLLAAADRETFLAERFDRLRDYTNEQRLGQALVHAGLLTTYQLERVLAGDPHGLVLGNYRVLEELGRGGMGTVYRAEHRLLKRRVAIKVVPLDEQASPIIRYRFQAEMRVLAELSHPHVVLALDAGELAGSGPAPPLVYLVMELVEGGDLEQLVARQGPCNVVQACLYIRQAAAGLQAAHDRHLVHRDIKPSNLLLASSGLLKLVDFGLARQFVSRITDPRALLGSIEFMPPEQSHDPSTVGKEADIYSLGATLFWLLTREGPYPYTHSAAEGLRRLQQQSPRRLRDLRPNVPPDLDELVAQMLDRCPTRRPPSAVAVMNALRPFVLAGSKQVPTLSSQGTGPRSQATGARPAFPPGLWDEGEPRALLVALPQHRETLRAALLSLGCECSEARDWRDAVEVAGQARFDVVVVDANLPDVAGLDVSCQLRSDDNPYLEVIVTDDEQWLARARRALTLKAAQDRVARLADQVLNLNQQLNEGRVARRQDLHEAHNALLFALAKVAESRDGETPGHLKRMQRYVQALAREAAREPTWQGLVTEPFLAQLHRCVPLHDIGKIGLPDDVLLKPASLTPAERSVVEMHVVIGDEILASLGREYGTTLEFLGMARAIVRHHHERFDGRGYPDRLVGEAIPPAARLVAVADVYDALRRMRLYKPAMPHQAAIRTMLDRSQGQFDPLLERALLGCHTEFERIYREIEE